MPIRHSRHRRRLCRAALLIAGAWMEPGVSAQPDWQFDPDLLRGSGVSAETIQRLGRPDMLLPGVYPLQLYVNGNSIARLDIRLAETADGTVQPCLDRALLLRGGVDPDRITAADGDCPALDAQVAGSRSELDTAHMRLNVSVPQSLMRRTPRGAVPVEALDAGDGMVFFNYMANVWHAQYSGAGSQDSAFVSLAGGANLGLWQYRQQGNLSGASGRAMHWRNLRSYLQRPLPGVAKGSQLTFGQLYGGGHFFSGLAYDGVSLASDPRVLPDQQRGFAPVVHGVANGNAKISIRQKGREIYQTTVPPGAFVIDDIAPTSYDGDLEVTVEEADGTVNRFRVPFSALPESLRPGHSRHVLSAGRTRNAPTRSVFADADYRYGVSNRVSAGAGVRVAVGYQALAADAVLLTRAGALGLTISHSRARLPAGRSESGWMAGLSYSRSFAPTQTHLAVAAYRHSTTGYRELTDVLGERFAARNGSVWHPDTARQRSRLDASIAQPLGNRGNLFVSASSQTWYNSNQHDLQFQMGWGTLLRGGVSLNVALMRQYTDNHAAPGAYPQHARDTSVNLSLSMPLGTAARAPTLTTGMSRSRSGNQYDANLTAILNDRISYNLGASRNQESGQTVWHGSLQQRLPAASIGVNASAGAQHRQVAANVQGALVLHRGGVTAGPWLGETFALIEAKGARGARVGGSGQARIGRNGYALLPALMPYRYNRVFLDPQDAANGVELENGEQRVAPYAGAAVRLHFNTRDGQALLIRVLPPDGQSLPPGTEAVDVHGRSAGLIGQGNWLYLRSETARGELTLRWGERANERCRLSYDTSGTAAAELIRMQVPCLPE